MKYYNPFEKQVPPPLSPEVFDRNVMESVKTKRLKDRIEITLPCGINEKDKEKIVEITGTALFNNTKYRQIISKDETVYLNLLADKIEESRQRKGVHIGEFY